MSRIIKFRAWNKKERRILDWFELNTMIIRSRCNYCNHYLELGQLENTFFEWMQFTGLLDRNGVEIYEGDILKLEQACPEVVGSVPLERYEAVEWRDDGWHIAYLISDEEGYRTGEVVGNIYETPEFLDPKWHEDAARVAEEAGA